MNIFVFFEKKWKMLISEQFVMFCIKYLCLSLLIILFSGCPPFPFGPKKGIDVLNKTDSTFYVAFSFNDDLFSHRPLVLYEEFRNDNNELILRYPCYRLNPYSRCGIGIPGRETLLWNCEDEKLRLFFILDTVIRKYSWEEICENQMYVRKLVLTEAELKANNWVVVYE